MTTEEATAYVKQTASQIGLAISNENLPSVVENWQRIAAIASLLNEFPLSDNIEAAPIFDPSGRG